MGEKVNTIHRREDILRSFGGWDGAPRAEPAYTVRAWYIEKGGYWYISTTDGEHQVISQADVVTDEDLVWCVGEHIRILRLPQYRK